MNRHSHRAIHEEQDRTIRDLYRGPWTCPYSKQDIPLDHRLGSEQPCPNCAETVVLEMYLNAPARLVRGRGSILMKPRAMSRRRFYQLYERTVRKFPTLGELRTLEQNSHWAIRHGSDLHPVCPISLVYFEVHGYPIPNSEWRAAAADLGMEEQFAMDVVHAADGCPEAPRVRATLLRRARKAMEGEVPDAG